MIDSQHNISFGSIELTNQIIQTQSNQASIIDADILKFKNAGDEIEKEILDMEKHKNSIRKESGAFSVKKSSTLAQQVMPSKPEIVENFSDLKQSIKVPDEKQTLKKVFEENPSVKTDDAFKEEILFKAKINTQTGNEAKITSIKPLIRRSSSNPEIYENNVTNLVNYQNICKQNTINDLETDASKSKMTMISHEQNANQIRRTLAYDSFLNTISSSYSVIETNILPQPVKQRNFLCENENKLEILSDKAFYNFELEAKLLSDIIDKETQDLDMTETENFGSIKYEFEIVEINKVNDLEASENLSDSIKSIKIDILDEKESLDEVDDIKMLEKISEMIKSDQIGTLGEDEVTNEIDDIKAFEKINTNKIKAKDLKRLKSKKPCAIQNTVSNQSGKGNRANIGLIGDPTERIFNEKINPDMSKISYARIEIDQNSLTPLSSTIQEEFLTTKPLVQLEIKSLDEIDLNSISTSPLKGSEITRSGAKKSENWKNEKVKSQINTISLDFEKEDIKILQFDVETSPKVPIKGNYSYESDLNSPKAQKFNHSIILENEIEIRSSAYDTGYIIEKEMKKIDIYQNQMTFEDIHPQINTNLRNSPKKKSSHSSDIESVPESLSDKVILNCMKSNINCGFIESKTKEDKIFAIKNEKIEENNDSCKTMEESKINSKTNSKDQSIMKPTNRPIDLENNLNGQSIVFRTQESIDLSLERECKDLVSLSNTKDEENTVEINQTSEFNPNEKHEFNPDVLPYTDINSKFMHSILFDQIHKSEFEKIADIDHSIAISKTPNDSETLFEKVSYIRDNLGDDVDKIIPIIVAESVHDIFEIENYENKSLDNKKIIKSFPKSEEKYHEILCGIGQIVETFQNDEAKNEEMLCQNSQIIKSSPNFKEKFNEIAGNVRVIEDSIISEKEANERPGYTSQFNEFPQNSYVKTDETLSGYMQVIEAYPITKQMINETQDQVRQTIEASQNYSEINSKIDNIEKNQDNIMECSLGEISKCVLEKAKQPIEDSSSDINTIEMDLIHNEAQIQDFLDNYEIDQEESMNLPGFEAEVKVKNRKRADSSIYSNQEDSMICSKKDLMSHDPNEWINTNSEKYCDEKSKIDKVSFLGDSYTTLLSSEYNSKFLESGTPIEENIFTDDKIERDNYEMSKLVLKKLTMFSDYNLSSVEEESKNVENRKLQNKSNLINLDPNTSIYKHQKEIIEKNEENIDFYPKASSSIIMATELKENADEMANLTEKDITSIDKEKLFKNENHEEFWFKARGNKSEHSKLVGFQIVDTCKFDDKIANSLEINHKNSLEETFHDTEQQELRKFLEMNKTSEEKLQLHEEFGSRFDSINMLIDDADIDVISEDTIPKCDANQINEIFDATIRKKDDIHSLFHLSNQIDNSQFIINNSQTYEKNDKKSQNFSTDFETFSISKIFQSSDRVINAGNRLLFNIEPNKIVYNKELDISEKVSKVIIDQLENGTLVVIEDPNAEIINKRQSIEEKFVSPIWHDIIHSNERNNEEYLNFDVVNFIDALHKNNSYSKEYSSEINQDLVFKNSIDHTNPDINYFNKHQTNNKIDLKDLSKSMLEELQEVQSIKRENLDVEENDRILAKYPVNNLTENEIKLEENLKSTCNIKGFRGILNEIEDTKEFKEHNLKTSSEESLIKCKNLDAKNELNSKDSGLIEKELCLTVEESVDKKPDQIKSDDIRQPHIEMIIMDQTIEDKFEIDGIDRIINPDSLEEIIKGEENSFHLKNLNDSTILKLDLTNCKTYEQNFDIQLQSQELLNSNSKSKICENIKTIEKLQNSEECIENYLVDNVAKELNDTKDFDTHHENGGKNLSARDIEVSNILSTDKIIHIQKLTNQNCEELESNRQSLSEIRIINFETPLNKGLALEENKITISDNLLEAFDSRSSFDHSLENIKGDSIVELIDLVDCKDISKEMIDHHKAADKINKSFIEDDLKDKHFVVGDSIRKSDRFMSENVYTKKEIKTDTSLENKTEQSIEIIDDIYLEDNTIVDFGTNRDIDHLKSVSGSNKNSSMQNHYESIVRDSKIYDLNLISNYQDTMISALPIADCNQIEMEIQKDYKEILKLSLQTSREMTESKIEKSTRSTKVNEDLIIQNNHGNSNQNKTDVNCSNLSEIKSLKSDVFQEVNNSDHTIELEPTNLNEEKQNLKLIYNTSTKKSEFDVILIRNDKELEKKEISIDKDEIDASIKES